MAGDGDDGTLFDPWTRDYATLGLRLGRLVPGMVLAWLGPPAWREAVEREPPPAPGALREAAASLLDRLPALGYAPDRAAHLARQVTALGAAARQAGGESLPLAEQVGLLLDLRPERAPEAVFAAAHAELEALLPGAGPLAERYDGWRRAGAVPAARLPPLLERVAAELRARTRRRLPLPAWEGVEFALGPDFPYSAYTRFLGRARSRIEINTRVPLHVAHLVEFLAHEAYPGHHTEHALREEHQYRRGAQGEYAIQLANTPAAVIWEGIAASARALLFDEDEDLAWLAAEVPPAFGLAVEPGRDAGVRAALRALDAVQGNASWLLHEDGRPDDEVAAYLARWSLLGPAAARRFVEHLQGPWWRVYVFAYSQGPRLLAPLLGGDGRFAALRRIMTEPVYPALLARWAGGAR